MLPLALQGSELLLSHEVQQGALPVCDTSGTLPLAQEPGPLNDPIQLGFCLCQA